MVTGIKERMEECKSYFDISSFYVASVVESRNQDKEFVLKLLSRLDKKEQAVDPRVVECAVLAKGWLLGGRDRSRGAKLDTSNSWEKFAKYIVGTSMYRYPAIWLENELDVVIATRIREWLKECKDHFDIWPHYSLGRLKKMALEKRITFLLNSHRVREFFRWGRITLSEEDMANFTTVKCVLFAEGLMGGAVSRLILESVPDSIEEMLSAPIIMDKKKIIIYTRSGRYYL